MPPIIAFTCSSLLILECVLINISACNQNQSKINQYQNKVLSDNQNMNKNQQKDMPIYKITKSDLETKVIPEI